MTKSSEMSQKVSCNLIGVDVSNHQGLIDWTKVAQDGVNFAFIKATEGATFKDRFWQGNARGAKAAGISCAPYHFFRSKSDVNLQLENFMSVITQSDPPELPVVLDLECPEDWTHIEMEKRHSIVRKFLEGAERILLRKPLIYMSVSFSAGILNEASWMNEYPLWIAHYTKADTPSVPKPWSKWTFWQHTNQGTINGISGNVDLNRFSGDDLMKI